MSVGVEAEIHDPVCKLEVVEDICSAATGRGSLLNQMLTSLADQSRLAAE